MITGQVIVLILVEIGLLVGYVALHVKHSGRLFPVSAVTVFAAGFIVYFMAFPIVSLLVPIKTAFPSEAMRDALVVTLLGQLAWGAGFFSTAPFGTRLRLPYLLRRETHNEMAVIWAVGFLVLVVLTTRINPDVTGPALWFVERIGVTVLLFAVMGVLTSRQMRWYWLVLGLTFLVATSGGIALNARREALKLALGSLIIWHLKKTPVRIEWAVALGLLFVVLVPQIAIWRGASNSVFAWYDLNVEIGSREPNQVAHWVLGVTDFPTAYENLEYLVSHVPNDEPHIFGSTYLKPFVWFVPRSLWPDKPKGVSVRFAQLDGQPNTYSIGTSEAVTIIGELFWNFGVVGVLIGMLLFGAGFRAAESIVLNFPRTVPTIMLYAITLAMLLEQFRGDFATVLLNYLIAAVIPLVFVCAVSLFVDRRSPR